VQSESPTNTHTPPGWLTKIILGLQLSFLPVAPLLGSSLPYWSTGFWLLVSGLFGWVISLSQGLCLNTGQHKHKKTQRHNKHPCRGRDSKPQSRPPCDWKLSMPQIARLQLQIRLFITFNCNAPCECAWVSTPVSCQVELPLTFPWTRCNWRGEDVSFTYRERDDNSTCSKPFITVCMVR
jgi:hypothetical protein